jgi:phenylpyruvate tautomerase
MPLLKLETTVVINDVKRKSLLNGLSSIRAQTTGKPEEYVMVTIGSAAIQMSGQPGDAAFVDIRGIGGLDDTVNRELSKKICELLYLSIGVPQKRIYLNFTNMEATNWGWNGTVFE